LFYNNQTKIQYFEFCSPILIGHKFACECGLIFQSDQLKNAIPSVPDCGVLVSFGLKSLLRGLNICNKSGLEDDGVSV